MIRSYNRCGINEPVIFSHCVHLELGDQFHALFKVCSDLDDTVPLKVKYVDVFVSNLKHLKQI